VTFPHQLKQPLKQALGRLARDAGLLPRLFRGKTLILAYHRVVTSDRAAAGLEPGMFVAVGTFARQLAFLKRHFNVVALARFLAEPQSREPRCVITFDDGWRDTYTNAFPLLAQAGVPATIFLASGYMGTTDWLWSDRAAYLVSRGWPGAHELWRRLVGIEGGPAGEAPAEFGARLICRLKGMAASGREETVERARQELGIAYPEQRLFLDWAEAAEMAAGGISFGCHTLGHTDLTGLEGAALEAELVEPLRQMQERPGFVPVLSYPYGAWSPQVAEAARAAGYAAAVTMCAGLNGAHTDRFALHRIGLHQDISSTDDLLAFRLMRAALG
jgi:peptidoglycan/xylan/chitin deacetylase (PgdA/CDA1 family)